MVEEYIYCCFTCISDYHDSHLNSTIKRWGWIPPYQVRGRLLKCGMTYWEQT